ncbi:MAG: cytochrome c oxidase subunit 3 [Planctomycetaceae bacterium]
MNDRWTLVRAGLARRFFAATILQALVVISGGLLLGALFGKQTPGEKLRIPFAFLISTALLVAGSTFIEQAKSYVRREQQVPFRRSMIKALVAAMLFVSVQGYGLWAIDKGARTPEQAQMGISATVVMFTVLHGMHFIVAQSVLLWVTLCAFADRYDHEYSWGVSFAAGFWHILGVVWLGILYIFIAAWIN